MKSDAAEHGDADFHVSHVDLLTPCAVTGHAKAVLSISYDSLTLRTDYDDEHHRDETLEGGGLSALA